MKTSEERKKYKRAWQLANPEKNREGVKKWIKANPDKAKKIYNKSVKNRKDNEPLFKLKCRVRSTISKILKRTNLNKNNKTQEILGCSYEEFKQHLESKFLPWMNWENYGKYNGIENYGWDIDHIIPLSSAITEESTIQLCHYSNLQPLCSKVNRDIKRDTHTIMAELSLDF